MDPRYKTLDASVMGWLLHIFQADDCIRTVASIYFDMLFSGGVSFERDSYNMDDTAKRWFSATWQAWFADVERNKKCVGFAACRVVPHPQYVGKPICLDLTQCLVLYRLDVNSIPHFVFFEVVSDPAAMLSTLPPTHNNNTNHSFMNYRYIPNVVVYVDQPPTKEGAITSIIASLAVDLDINYTLKEAVKLATRNRAAPPLVTEAVRLKPNVSDPASKHQQGGVGMAALYGDGSKPNDEDQEDSQEAARANATVARYYEPQEQHSPMNAIYERQRYEYSRALGMYGDRGLHVAERMARHWVSRVAADGIKEHPLSYGRTVGRQLEAQSPDALFIAFRPARNERVLNAFGIPMGMLSQTSSLGDGSKQSQDANSFVVFLASQKRKREQLLECAYSMYDRIFAHHHAKQAFRDNIALMAIQSAVNQFTKVGMTPGQGKRMMAGTKATIRMAGLPDDSLLDNLFKMGVLKYEAYIRYKSDRHSIPKEDFEATPQMSLKDLNGIKPEPTGTAESASSIKPAKAKKQ
jgi:hypothetical protein